MNNTLILFSLIVISSMMSCKSQNNAGTHSHGAHGVHTHNDMSTSKPATNYFGNYSLINEHYGTRTVVTIEGTMRKMTTNALPNHKTGDFPNQGNPNQISAQQNTYEFPLHPKYTGKATWAREPGVALNGVKFEPQTAEVVQCETGENYRVEAIQTTIDLGLDFNHAHVQPTGAYHYHGTPTSLIEQFDTGEDLVHIGFAHDGFPLYYSKSGKYKPSYKLMGGTREGEDCIYENPMQQMDISVNGHHDGTYGSDYEFIEGLGDLDECNGIKINGTYMYLVTQEFPYVGRCLMGTFKTQQGPQGANQNERRGGKPDYAELLQMMDANNDEKISKQEAKGPLNEFFSRIDTNNDGFITKDEMNNAPKPRRPNSKKGKQ